MSQPCAIKTCKRASRTLCHCCDQHLCRDHFNEHDDLLNSQLNPLTDQINSLGDRFASLNLNRITGDYRQKLDQWRIDCYRKIDDFYEQKCQELDQYVTENIDKQRKEITDLRSKITALIDTQETTKNDISYLTSTIGHLEEKMNEIEQIRIQVDIHPLIIDDHLIHIGRPNMRSYDLSSLSFAYRTIDRLPESDNSLASNNRYLLTHLNSNLCLIDENLSIIKQKAWNNISIEDICWSSTLNCFIVITESDIFLVNENTMSIDQVPTTQREIWLSCGCSDKSLYLSHDAYDSSLLEFSLIPSIKFLKHWKTPGALGQQGQRFDSIVCNYDMLILGINDADIQAKLIEIRSSKNFDLLWSIQLKVNYNDNIIRCCLLNQNEWLVTDWYTSSIFHIKSDEKVPKKYEYTSEPYNMTLFNSNILAILTEGRINFHKL